ncbi:MAG TPA: hypothetical protein VLA77_00310 [Candidatus Saccharimonadales bacterium]|nr:hypothetical protein [Candidatus Saccharimonadales bacterium]
MSKKLILTAAVIGAFFIGYGGMVLAYPAGGIQGRAEHRGYFTNSLDTAGWEVLNQSCSTGGEYGPYNYNNGNNWCNAIPRDLNTAAELIAFIEGRLANGIPNGSYGFGSGTYGDARAKTGAAFIVHTMLGTPAAERSRPPTAAQMTEWRALVNAYASAGRISWSTNYAYNINTYYQGTDDSPSPNDDAFFDYNNDGLAILFRSSPTGTVQYAIRRECGNPVGNGNILPLPNPVDFTMNGRTTVNGSSTDITVNPGASLSFVNYLSNSGPSATPSSITWSAHNMPGGASISSGNAGTFTSGQEKTAYSEPAFTVPNGTAAGTQYCRQVRWSPLNESGGSGTGATRCATVAAAYDLVPVTGVSPSTTAQDGDTITFTFTIDNVGSNNSPSVSCTVNGTQPGGIAGPPSTSCPTTFTWNAGSPTVVATQNITISGQAPGSQICRSLTVSPATPSVGSRTSSTVCVTIVKTPYVHFMGGDVWAGGGLADSAGACTNGLAKITTSSRTLSGGAGYAGSMVEYASFSLGAVTSFGSASKALVNGAPAGPTALAKALTFSNTQAIPGNFAAPQHCIKDYAADYANVTTACPSAANVASPPTTPCKSSGMFTISTGTLPAGSKQVYIIDGNVNITGLGINYPATYTDAASIPSLVVIATGDIMVNGSVRNLSGIFISRGTFFTCQEKPPLPAATCNSDLLVDGAIIARRLDLYRTAGAEGSTVAARRAPAEIIKLSPEVFLTNALNDSSSTVITTSQVRELPPRF